MKTSRSVVPSKLRLQAADALRRARLLPIGPHRNDLRQLAIGLRALDLRDNQEAAGLSIVSAGIVPRVSDMQASPH